MSFPSYEIGFLQRLAVQTSFGVVGWMHASYVAVVKANGELECAKARAAQAQNEQAYFESLRKEGS